MRDMIVARLSRRAFLGATALSAFALVSIAPLRGDGGGRRRRPGGMAAELRGLAQDGGRARVDADPVARHGRKRPRPRSRNIRTSSPRGGWNSVPPGGELKIGSKGPRVQALRDRLVASGDLDPIAGAGRHLRFLRRGGGQALPGPPRPRPDRRRQPGSVRRTQRARRGAPAAARDQHRPAEGLFRRSRPPLRHRQHSRRLRSRRSRAASSIPTTPPASARSTGSRRSCRPARPRSISTRSGPCRLR